jgi:hypothetical protein
MSAALLLELNEGAGPPLQAGPGAELRERPGRRLRIEATVNL